MLSTLLNRNTHTSPKLKPLQLDPYRPGSLLGLNVYAYPHFHVLPDDACELLCRELISSILDWTRDPVDVPKSPTL